MPTPSPNHRYEFSAQAGSGSQDFAFDPFLFLREAHLNTQGADNGDRLVTLQLRDQKNHRIVAHWPVFLNDAGVASSPGRAPFGGPQIAPGLSAAVVEAFLEEAVQYLVRTENATEIRLKSYPMAYAPATAGLLTFSLLRLGFGIVHSEINHHLAVTPEPLESKLHDSARRRLQKCLRHRFTFQEESRDFLPQAYDFIRHCRCQRNYGLSLTFPQLEDLFRRFPESFRIFSVRTPEGETAACTIAVRINGEVLYNFYPASLQQFNTFSPAILLTEGLYRVCQREDFGILDLGTSMLPSGLNFPLIAFKNHLGGEAALKLTFRLNLAK